MRGMQPKTGPSGNLSPAPAMNFHVEARGTSQEAGGMPGKGRPTGPRKMEQHV